MPLRGLVPKAIILDLGSIIAERTNTPKIGDNPFTSHSSSVRGVILTLTQAPV